MSQGIVRTCFVLMFMIILVVGGCAKDQDPDKGSLQDEKGPSHELKGLLPQEAGFRWVYSGFAEYGHTMELKSVISGDDAVRYETRGNVYDPSGGEAPGDFSLEVEYEVTGESLIMRKDSEKMMDNFPEIELIRLPLREGTQWEQEVKDKKGKTCHLLCTIQEIEEQNGSKVYTVLYEDKNSDFYEKRLIEENWGVVSFETVWESPEGPVTMGYELYREASGCSGEIILNSFIPPLEKQLRYFGLAEYGHEGELVLISAGREKAVYQFNGEFRDGSGIPGQFKVQYHFDYREGTVREAVIANSRDEKNEVNSKMHDPIIFKLPLEVGNTWQQEVIFEGEKKVMTATIASIAYEGRTFYSQMKKANPVVTVRYTVADVPGYFQDMYVEERRFQKGLGMVGFSKLMEGDLGLKYTDDEYRVEQAIMDHMFGYSLAGE